MSTLLLGDHKVTAQEFAKKWEDVSYTPNGSLSLHYIRSVAYAYVCFIWNKKY